MEISPFHVGDPVRRSMGERADEIKDLLARSDLQLPDAARELLERTRQWFDAYAYPRP